MLGKKRQTDNGEGANLESIKATLDCARADVQTEAKRTDALDAKLTNIAAFSGVSLSISGSVGGTVVAGGRLDHAFTIALGSTLGLAATLLLASVLVAFSGLTPRPFQSVSLKGARDRVADARLARPPEEVLSILARTYYLKVLPQARATNAAKVGRVKRAFVLVGFGFATLVVALVLTVVGSTT